MFVAKIKKAELIKKIMSSIKNLVFETSLIITENGISIKTPCLTFTTFTIIEIEKKAFSSFVYSTDMVLGVSIGSLCTILSRAKDDEEIEIKVDKKNNFMIICIYSTSSHHALNEFSLSLITIDSPFFFIDSHSFTSIIEIDALEFEKICKNLKTFGNYVTIQVQEDSVLFSIKEQENPCIKLFSNSSSLLSIQEGSTPYVSTFSLYHLCLISSMASSLTSSIFLKFSTLYPLILSCSCDDIGVTITHHLVSFQN